MQDTLTLDQLCINTIRTLSMDAVEKAKSGHPGTPMGLAAPAYVLWTRYLKHNPKNPKWINRDRFVLSAGHASMLIYSLLYLTGYDLSLEDIKQFRQLDSKTPGHPEYGHVPGVEITTGPLGQGLSSSVGMAMAEKYLSAYFNRPDYNIIDYKIYTIAGDGDLMEGVASEAASLAGHLKLDNLICIYDSNNTTIEGHTNLAFSEDVIKRFEAYGWHTIIVHDANNLDTFSKAIEEAQKVKDKPVLIETKTHIGYGSPNKQDSSKAHGSPLGEQEVILSKKNLGWDRPEETFIVPDSVLNHTRKLIEKGHKLESEWNKHFKDYEKMFPEFASELYMYLNKYIDHNWTNILPSFEDKETISTRAASGITLNALTSEFPQLIGGSADLAPSNNTLLDGFKSFSSECYTGKNIHFGVREHAMGAICNGIALSNCLVPYCATFLVFADYLRPSIRLACLMKQQVIYVFTHDSIAVGEDGPTHQPVEHLASLRTLPNLCVIRPADANETKYAWKIAIENRNNPTALVLSRQNLPVLDQKKYTPASELEKGAYIIANTPDRTPDAILLASGSEVSLALSAREKLLEENIHARVISFPSWELFEKQTDEYKRKVLPPQVTARVVIEAASSFGWERYAGNNAKFININNFGKSAPGNLLMKKYGFTVENIIDKVKKLLL